MKSRTMEIVTVVCIPFEENTYVARFPGRNDCVVVDPGLDPEKIMAALDAARLVPAAILNTHGHADHIAGNGSIKARWPECPLVIGAEEAAKLTNPQLNLSSAFGGALVSPAADVTVRDGQAYEAAGLKFEVRSIPGHSAGHIVFVAHDHDPPIVFVGDVIFSGSIGRTDFPDGDFRQLLDGIRRKLFTLPGKTVLLPGHGPPTTVEREEQSNPFLN